jgi:prophage antirepressor-like protein
MDIVKAFNSNQMHTEIVIKGNVENPLFRASDIATVLEINNIRSNILDFDDSEKISESIETPGGSQQVSFLTEKGLYKVLFKSRKPIAQIFQNWVCDVIKEIRINGAYSLKKQLEEQQKVIEQQQKINAEQEKANEELQKQIEDSTDNVPTIYIWNTDTLISPSELKIGITLNVNKRIKPYKQVNKRGKIEFSEKIINIDIKLFEKIIHGILSSYKVKDEIFKLDVEEAKLTIVNFINFINVIHISNSGERIHKLQELYDSQNKIIHNIKDSAVATRSIETQIYPEDWLVELQTNPEDNPTKDISTESFDKYIEEVCIVRPDVEVSSTDILGQYRIWKKSATKKTYHDLKDYLDRKFKNCRLSLQNKNQVVNGYKGVTLREIEYKRQVLPSDVEHFIFHACQFHPSRKVLHSNLYNEYMKWKNTNGKIVTNDETNELRKYLKDSNYTLYTTIWTSEGNGQGYYGICLKNEMNDDYKKTSTTGKKVEKRQINTDILLGTWETIAKTATSEKLSSAKLSRMIKNKIISNDYYYKTN